MPFFTFGTGQRSLDCERYADNCLEIIVERSKKPGDTANEYEVPR